jgi:hypothetical protein
MNIEHGMVETLGTAGYHLLGVAFFITMCGILYRTAVKD